MTAEERQFLKTAAWMFARHGQRARALAVCEALVEDEPRDGSAALALSELLLGEGGKDGASRAIAVLRTADIPESLVHAGAVLETRALKLAGRDREAASRWNRYVEARKGAGRKWLAK